MKTSSLIQLLESHKVVIPMIQRDYAHGREYGKAPLIRKRFLTEIVNNLSDSSLPPLELDFIYGYTNEQENNTGKKIIYFTPLDGQQRLTTLYLIHWFVAAKMNYVEESEKFLKIKTSAIKALGKGRFQIPIGTIVTYQSKRGVYTKLDGWFEVKDISLLVSHDNYLVVQIRDYKSEKLVASSGLGFLRAAHLQASGQGGKGHAH